ncbi:MAG: protein translocase subunit SecD [Limisphaerales bacterium]
MNRNNYWRVVLVVLVILWSLYELYPPEGRDLIQYFRQRARGHDTAFGLIVQKAEQLEAKSPGKQYENLKEAIGTNDITRYFPFFEAKEETDPTRYVLNRLQREAAGRIRLGLDLQGGTSFLVRMDTSALTNVSDSGAALSQAVEVLRRRVDRFGVAEPLIQPQGKNEILVQLPGLSAASQQDAIDSIKRAAYLEFRMVHPDSKELLPQGIVPPGYEIMKLKEKEQGRMVTVSLLVKKRPELTGSSISRAMAQRDHMGQPDIEFELNAKGAEIFGQVTRENVGHQLAIVLDGEIRSAPVIRGPIETGSGEITGQFDMQEAVDLANVLENPLRAPLLLEASSQVDPTMGTDAIHSGIRASIFSIVAVSAFMLCYYLIAGMVANVALVANIIILLGVMCSVGTTLTLPGIAGVVLTAGMAVDANVLIYERIREEQGKGKSLRGAIAAGYSRAFSTIFDSHVTTLISSVILIFMGTGSIKGFGVALTIGVAASLFTSLVVTRIIFDWMVDHNWLKSIKMFHLIPSTMKLDFMKLAKPAFITSWVIITIGVAYGFYRGKSTFGRDFIGGDTVTCYFKKKIEPAQIRSALEAAGIKDPRIQYQKELGTGTEALRLDTLADPNNVVMKTLEQVAPGNFTLRGSERVGASVGSDITHSAIIASLLSLFGILVYVAFRYEFSFAVGAVLAVIHDVLMTIGLYCLSGRQFNATTVAAVLTIIGFSTNDTIVIFDRIRESLKLGIRGTFKEVMNLSLNQTLSRTIITSGTVFLATFSLFIFGGGEINDFAFTFLIGIITGTYSSIYIASALVLWWHKGQRPQIGAGPVAVESTAAARGQRATPPVH